MNPKIQVARDFAIRAHGSQQYGHQPYVYHLDSVAELLISFGEEAIIAAYLHDTVEDTETTLEDIRVMFGEDSAACVHLLTDEPGENRKARKAKTNEKLSKTSNTLALTVKAADRLANLQEASQDPASGKLEMYRREHDAFRLAVYRPGLCDELWVRIDAIIDGTA
ncbi:MAG: HD domain-containing protein [Planctomycetes bacterium]|nr:HD domain-containing protein [Planctomycetota bacterium]